MAKPNTLFGQNSNHLRQHRMNSSLEKEIKKCMIDCSKIHRCKGSLTLLECSYRTRRIISPVFLFRHPCTIGEISPQQMYSHYRLYCKPPGELSLHVPSLFRTKPLNLSQMVACGSNLNRRQEDA